MSYFIGDQGNEQKSEDMVLFLQLVPAVISVVALAKTSWDDTTKLAVGALALAAAGLSIRANRNLLKRVLDRFREWRVAWTYRRELEAMASAFGQFLDGSSFITLHSNLHGKSPAANKLHDSLPSYRIWYDFGFHVLRDLKERPRNRKAFVNSWGEVYTWIESYNTNCVTRVFSSCPQDVLNALTPDEIRGLNAFWHRFNDLLQRYERIGRDISARAPSLRNCSYTFAFSKPL